MPYYRTSLAVAGFQLILALCSCDPGFGVVILNSTNTARRIQVFYPPNFKFPGDSGSHKYIFYLRDSVKTFNQADKDNYLHPVIIPMLYKDTIAWTYSFVLNPNYSAIIESRFLAAYPTFGQIFIIDETDTIELVRHGKDFVKKPKLMLGGGWTHTIKD